MEKIMEIDDHIACAVSGLSSDARTLVEHTQVETQNHRFSYANSTENHRTKHRCMDKYKALVSELINTQPNNTRLLPSQISIIQDRLTDIVSQFHTPDHPPYAAMIQKALQELNQKGGSSVESISHFIKREYDDLPWAHFTLLEHHLDFLCKRGEIVVNSGLLYSLDGAGSGVGSKKGRRKNRKRRLRWAFERRQSKRRMTEVEKLENEDKNEVIEELSQVGQQNQAFSNEIIKRENGKLEGLQQLKPKCVVGSRMLQISVGERNGISSGSGIDRYEYQAEFVMQQEEKCEPGNTEMINLCDPNAQQLQKRKSNEDNMLESFSPERPPGFESMIVENLSNSQESLTAVSHPEMISTLVAPSSNLVATPINSEYHPLHQDHEEVLPVSIILADMQQIEPGEYSAPSTICESSGVCDWKGHMQFNSTSETSSSPPSENHIRDSEKRFVVETIVPDGLSCSLQQEKKKLFRERQNQLSQIIKQREVVLALPNQQQEHTLLDIEQMQEKLPLVVSSMESQQQKSRRKCRENRKAMQTTRGERQLRRWSRSPSEPRPTAELLLSLELSEKFPLLEMLSDVEKPEDQNQMTSESNQMTNQRAKLRSWKKQNGFQIDMRQRQLDGDLEEAANTDDWLRTSHQHGDQMQRQHPCNGTPPKAKPDAISERDSNHVVDENQQAQNQSERLSCRTLSQDNSDLTISEALPVPNTLDNSQQGQKLDLSAKGATSCD